MYSRGSVIPLFVRLLGRGEAITITEPTMTRFLMPLWDSVELVKYALTHCDQGDLFIKKAPASTIETLASALKDLFRRPDLQNKIIGWRHGEKLFETLATAQELSTSVDEGDYWRIPMDDRDLNYNKYFVEGDQQTVQQEEFNSHNTRQLDVEGVQELLLELPEIQRDLEAAGVR
jgi:UDP-glucose 4-epimerase